MEFLYLLFIILTCYLLYRDVINSQWESFITYTKCKKFRNNKLLQYALDDMHIKKYNGNNSKWDLFIPCNYTHVESELIKRGSLYECANKLFACCVLDINV